MASWADFDSFFGPRTTYDVKLANKIISHRRKLNPLFFDRLLSAVGVKQPEKIYPPEKPKELRQLHQAIIKSSAPSHHKQALIYYILKDLDVQETSDHFVNRTYLPAKYRLFINGLWHLDRLECASATEYLTEPSLISTYPDEILSTLIEHGKDQGQLAIAFYTTVSPPLSSIDTLRSFFAIVCQQTTCGAFYFARKKEEARHKLLFEDLIVDILSDSSDRKSARAVELITLPLSRNEQEWFDHCLFRGRASHLHGARDTVMMRRVGLGELQPDQGDLSRLSGRNLAGTNWSEIRKNLTATLGPRV